MTIKARTKDKQHVVGIEPNEKGTVYKPAYVNVWRNGKKDPDAE